MSITALRGIRRQLPVTDFEPSPSRDCLYCDFTILSTPARIETVYPCAGRTFGDWTISSLIMIR